MVDKKESRILKKLKTAMLFSVFIILAALGFNIYLRRKVKLKTRELVEKNRELLEHIDMRIGAESALRQSHQLLEKIYDSMPDGLLLVSGGRDCRIVNCNKSACSILGYQPDELLKRPLDAIYASSESSQYFYLKFISCGNSGFSEEQVQLKRRCGSTFSAEVAVNPINIIDAQEQSWAFIFRDITERIEAQEALKESELRLRQAQKMEAIGTLAGGIAHDFNNTLAPIIGYAEMSVTATDKNSPLRSYMDQILKAADRAKRLVGQILNFSRQNEPQAMNVKISYIIDEVMKMLKATLPSTIRTELRIETDEDVVFADSTQIHQVIMNLCANAAHAMKNKKGILEIVMKDSDGRIEGWCEDSRLTKDNYLEIIVRDNGHGIEESVLHRIFDPFFTTKPLGEGSGMGLAVVHGIIKNAGGAISLETEVGHGTAFHIYLPKVATKPVMQKEEANSGDSIDVSKRILFIDDEEMIARMAKNMLNMKGYDVTIKTNSQEALQEFKGNPSRFDLVITDQTMPGITGIEIAREMLAIKHNLQIVLISGYSEDVTEEKIRNLGIKAYLMKPFSCDDILAAIRA